MYVLFVAAVLQLADLLPELAEVLGELVAGGLELVYVYIYIYTHTYIHTHICMLLFRSRLCLIICRGFKVLVCFVLCILCVC